MRHELTASLSFLRIARIEGLFFRRYPQLLLAAAVLALIPALYVLIYLTSVWDPAAKTGALPVAIVNLDRGLEYREHTFNVGRDLASRLKSKPAFGYVDFADEQQARRQVLQGMLAFALVVPPDFSSNAVPGAQAGAGKLVVFTSEGNSYPGAGLARRFAEDIGREVNQSLNEQRWTLVLADAAGSQRSLERLHEAVLQLRLGAKELASGAQQAASGAQGLSAGAIKVDQGIGQLATGVREMGNGLRSMFAQRPRNADLRRLEEGTQALVAGHDDLGRGLMQLQQGAQRLQPGVSEFREEASNSVFVATRVKEGLNQLGDGLGTLELGLKNAVAAQQKLGEGTVQVQTGVGTLITGLRSFNSGLRSMVIQLPEDSRVEELVRGSASLASAASTMKAGSQKVAVAAQHLAGGTALLEDSLPLAIKKIDGNAQGLATSVQPVMEIAAAVQNNGSGFAPNIIPGALWLGASLAVFLIQMRLLPLFAARLSLPARLAGKMVIPGIVVLLQALLVWTVVVLILQVNTLDASALALTLGLSSLTFLLIIVALTRAFGDGGKALALVLLAVQLSSSGGVLPVELSGGLFARISPFLPITWVVKAIKASLFGAFEGDWQHPLQLVVVAGVLAAVIACFVGPWRFVKNTALRPALDL